MTMRTFNKECGSAATSAPRRRYVIFSHSEASAGSDWAGFWSNEEGWTVAACATRFDEPPAQLPSTSGNDARVIAEPKGYLRFRVSLIDYPQLPPDEQQRVDLTMLGSCRDRCLFMAQVQHPFAKVVGIEALHDPANKYEGYAFDGRQMASMMREHRVTREWIRKRFGISFKRILEVRTKGVSGPFAAEWVYMITGTWPDGMRL